MDPEFLSAFFFSALRFLVTVSSDSQRLQFRVEGVFQQTPETILVLAFTNLNFSFHRALHSANGAQPLAPVWLQKLAPNPEMLRKAYRG